MNQTTTILNEIISFIFGRRYYANIVNTRGTRKCEISCYIFLSRRDALDHRDALADNRSFQYVQTVSFRSRHDYSNSSSFKNN